VIPKPSAESLLGVGRWLKVNGESIYGAGRTPFGEEFGKKLQPPPAAANDAAPPAEWRCTLCGATQERPTSTFAPSTEWRCTTKPGKLYLHLFQWPENGKFKIPAVKQKITKAYLLADPQKAGLKVTQSDSGVSIALPGKASDPTDSVVCHGNSKITVTKFRIIKNPLITLLALATLLPAAIQAQPTETKEQRDARMSWWREARFGMFIHWNVSAVPAGFYQGKPTPTQGTKGFPSVAEWIMLNCRIPVAEYKAFAKDFNPVQYNAEEWVKLAKEAGMKYIVITAKHHDGFAMFDTKASELEYRASHSLRQRPSQGTGRGLPQTRDAARLLLLAGARLGERRFRPQWPLGQGAGPRYGRLH